jgi:hypothetical protein
MSHFLSHFKHPKSKWDIAARPNLWFKIKRLAGSRYARIMPTVITVPNCGTLLKINSLKINAFALGALFDPIPRRKNRANSAIGARR